MNRYLAAAVMTCPPASDVPHRNSLLSVQLSIQEQLLSRNVERCRGGLVFKAHRLVYHSTLGLRVIKKKKKSAPEGRAPQEQPALGSRISGFGL